MEDVEFVPVSVVIPCYRCSRTITRTFESIVQQSQKPVEVILVDDASEDDSSFHLRGIAHNNQGWVKLILLDENLGAASARNAGWSIATQPYVAFLDADDSWHPDKLRIQYAYMKMNADVALSGHRCVEVDSRQALPPLAESWTVSRIFLNSLLFKNAFSTPSVMLVRDIPFRFEPGKRYGEDFLLWQQVAASGLQVAKIELPLAYVHKPFYGSDGLSAQLWEMERGELTGFVILYQGGAIGVVMCVAAMTFSILKFGLRVVVVQWKGIKRILSNVMGHATTP